MSAVVAPARALRRHRAAVAARLLAHAPERAIDLDWDTLDRAPAWLAAPDDDLDLLCRRVGAVVHAPTIRLWIDATRLGAARTAVGRAFLQRLRAGRGSLAPVSGLAADDARGLDAALAVAGAGVLVASVPAGTLRDAAAAALRVAGPAPMITELARRTVDHALALAEEVR